MVENLEALKQQRRELDAKIRAIEKEISETVSDHFRVKHHLGEYIGERKEWFWSVSFKQTTVNAEQRWTRLFRCKTMDEAISKLKIFAKEALDFSEFLQNKIREEG